MPNARDFPYIWVTQISKILSGESMCEWLAQFKAHYYSQSYPKVPSNFDFAKWNIEHTDLLLRVRDGLQRDGATVFIEDQNHFQLGQKGRNVATLAGKPDLVVVDGQSGVVSDVKTGRESPAHIAQVMLYMYCLPKSLPQYKDVKFDGKVIYSDHEIFIPAARINDEFKNRLGKVIKRIASADIAIKVPSFRECNICELTLDSCSEKITQPPTMSATGTDDF